MGNGFLDRVEDNAAVRTWFEMTLHVKGDSLAEGHVSELWDFTRVSIDKRLFRALAQFWNLTYNYFTFGKVDLVPTIEEYMALLQCSRIQGDRIYSKAVNVPIFLRKLMNITGMSEQWVTARIKQKGDSSCIPWKNLKDLILVHPDAKKKVDIFALIIYGMVMFPKALGHVDEVVTDLFDRLDKRVTLVSSLQEEDIEWRALWLLSSEILYRCGDFDWVSLLGIWGAVGYAPLLVLRQYRSRQFVPITQGLVECEFSYKDDGYKKKAREMANAWNQTHRMKRLAVAPMTTPEYSKWWVRRINDNIPGPSSESSQSIEEHLRIVPSELEIIKQDFERRNAELEKKIESKSDRWERKFQEVQARNEALEKSLSVSQKEKGELKDRVVELEGSLRQYRSQNSVIELKASLSKIEEVKSKIEELEAALRNCEIREVADHLQTFAVKADTLSVKYELESD
ncbi:hypothetical protein Gotur_019745 [Gossypium turneri]